MKCQHAPLCCLPLSFSTLFVFSALVARPSLLSLAPYTPSLAAFKPLAALRIPSGLKLLP
jgi:hypothetical protein